MRVTHLAGVDLNLLPLLDALLHERHLTRAARRVGLSQPAASRALSRLRVLLNDPILVRSGAVYTLTPRADALREPVRNALGMVENVIAPAATFDPAVAQRTVRIAADDYTSLVVLAPLVGELSRTAPGFNLVVVPGGGTALDRLARGEVECSFSPASDHRPPGADSDVLFDDGFVCMVSNQHSFARRTPTLTRFLRARHALVAPLGRGGRFVDDALAAIGKQRQVSLMLPHFLAMPFAIAASDLVVTIAERVARIYAQVLPVKLFQPPLSLPKFRIASYWHERDRHDPALAWLRMKVKSSRFELAKAARSKLHP
jgi:DNA-binding transcriptional LysR family regulator